MAAMTRRATHIGAIAAACALWTALPVTPARAWAGVTAWPTFLRTGPGSRFVVIDELLRGTRMDVQSCSDTWCTVQVGRVVGYVAQTDIGRDGATTVFVPPATAVGCFDSRRAGYRAGEVFRYCPRTAGTPGH